MKGGIACFMSALSRIDVDSLNYSIGFLLRPMRKAHPKMAQ